MSSCWHPPRWYDIRTDPTGFVMGLLCYQAGLHGDAQELSEYHEFIARIAWER